MTTPVISEQDKTEIAENIDIRLENDINAKCCGNCEEEIEEGEVIFSKLQIDYSTPLYNSSKIPKIHFVVPTSQSDWQHDACLEKENSVQATISLWCNENLENFTDIGEGESFNCNVTSLPKNILDIEVMRDTKNNVLILPHFLWINDLKSENVKATLDDLVPSLLEKKIDRDTLLKEKPYLSGARERAFVFICSHKTRDKRCGVTAPVIKRAFDKELQAHGLYRDNSDFRADGVNVSFTNHVGGHKFAANVLIYIKNSNTLVWLGRVTPKHVPLIVDSLLLPETPALPWPEMVRCIKKYESW
ncbi:hypothetical protein Kpol_1053p39 [Vanderwaltozyma polyspora DSM 70294]|uniref:Actin patches distal protein 1 n=1 Tax=Vanderwaltozyma polyspora (strain ATCC 22028 / DSM 70294 / BCRC 21397 / CBS 2163 / NBRC 10782 / NRRL Y-8283 / UCD 57-17) TaxID=436907 RepID=A7TN83_VANPO|nr:uncharacterized protein Kpol_1053p39 [Vanderwaltozyma polyspora DSM 70294]EDO16301.1 hypothetical protein Kpol_1053p39 [Vanderwaltozyma polyspora DSM 70294]